MCVSWQFCVMKLHEMSQLRPSFLPPSWCDCHAMRLTALLQQQLNYAWRLICVFCSGWHSFLEFSTLPHSAFIRDGYAHSELTISDTKVVVLEKWMDINVDVHISHSLSMEMKILPQFHGIRLNEDWVNWHERVKTSRWGRIGCISININES